MYLEQASSLYERCTSGILSTCMLLHFAYADFEEQRRNNEKVRISIINIAFELGGLKLKYSWDPL